ncbi:hypothetical protein PspLS_08843 [Pyricularia sp. CBS 133598]|nr:hypothetical protein PspLS_08843 [Pyricularia sp. CBS 133598]
MAVTFSPGRRNITRLANGAPDLNWNRPLADGVKSCTECLLESADKLEASGFKDHFEISCDHQRSSGDKDHIVLGFLRFYIIRSCAIDGSIFAAREDILALFKFIKEHTEPLGRIPTSVNQIKMALHEALCKTLEVEREFSKEMNKLVSEPIIHAKSLERIQSRLRRLDGYKAELALRRDHFRLRGPFPYDGDIVEKRAWHLASLPRLLPTDGPYERFHLAIDGLLFQQERFLRKAAKVVSESVRDEMPPVRLLSQALRLRDGVHAEYHSDTKHRDDQESAADVQENRKPGKSAQAGGETRHRLKEEKHHKLKEEPRHKPKQERGHVIAKKVKPEPQDRLPIVFPADRKRKTTHAATDEPGPDKRPKLSTLNFGAAPRLATQNRKDNAPRPKIKGRTSGDFVFGKVTKSSMIPGFPRKTWR